MTHPNFETFRTYLEESDPEAQWEPTPVQLASPPFWLELGTHLLHYIDRRIEDPEPFEWYGHFLDKSIEALAYAHQLTQQATDIDPVMPQIVAISLGFAYFLRGHSSLIEGAYDAAFLDFDAAVTYNPDPQYQQLRAKALAQLNTQA